jgi:hypothetical protein
VVYFSRRVVACIIRPCSLNMFPIPHANRATLGYPPPPSPLRPDSRKDYIMNQIKSSEPNDEADCPSCRDPWIDPDNGRTSMENEIVEIHCGHRFHRDCIEQWLSAKNTCPMCRSVCFPLDMWSVDQWTRGDEREQIRRRLFEEEMRHMRAWNLAYIGASVMCMPLALLCVWLVTH